MEDDSIPGSVIVLAIGIVVGGLGLMVAASSTDVSQARLGAGLAYLGAGLACLGLVIEFFCIGASLRRITRLLSASDLDAGREGINKDTHPAG